MRLKVTIHSQSIVAERYEKGSVAWVAQSEACSVEDREASLAGLSELDGWKPVVTADVILTDGLLQRRRLRDVPPVGHSALADLVALQQARFFRRHRAPLVTAARWVARDRGEGATAIAADAELVDAVARGLDVAGVHKVTFLSPDDQLKLHAPHQLGRMARRRRILSRSLLLVAACSWVCAGLVHMGRLALADRRLTRELNGLDGPARALTRAHRDLDAAARVIAQVETSLSQRQRLATLLNRIVLSLPDSAFVISLSLSGDGIGSMTGVAREPDVVVNGLERVTDITSPRLDGAAGQSPGPGQWATFSLRFGRAVP